MRLLATLAAVALVAAPAAAQPGRGAGIEVTGATSVTFDQPAGVWTFRGAPVVVRRGSLTLRAPLIRYRVGPRRLDASDGAELEVEDLVLRAPGLAAYLQESLAVTNGRTRGAASWRGRQTAFEGDRIRAWWRDRRALATGSVVLQQPNARVTADQIELDQNAQAAVATGSVVVEQEDGRLSAGRVEFDQATQTAVATASPVLEVQGATITAPRVAAELDAHVVTATGGVHLVRGDLIADAPEGRFDRDARVLTLSGGARLVRGGDVLTAQVVRITFLEGGGVLVVAQGDPKVTGTVKDESK